MNLQTFFARDPADSDERRVEKFAILQVTRGPITVKGKDVMESYFVSGRKGEPGG